MKQLNTKKRRSPWLHFGFAGVVVVLLSLGISQMLPKSHPIRALRGLNEGTDSASESVEVQGAPLAVAGAVTRGDESEDETNPELRINASEREAPSPAFPKPIVGRAKDGKRKGSYLPLTFEALTNFTIEEPDWVKMDDPAYIATLNLDADIPSQIKALNGERIEIEGFMLPLEGEVDNLRSFVLLKDQLACCFGITPLLNEWVYVKVPDKKKIGSYFDELVTLYGTLGVGAEFEDDLLTGIYHLELDRLEAVEVKLGGF